MALKLVMAPASDPVDLATAKAHLRVDGTDENALIAALIAAARQYVEVVTRRALIAQTWELVLDAFPAGDIVPIPLPPLRSVTALTCTDNNGIATVWDAVNYVVDTDSEPGRLVLAYGKSWPSITLAPAGGVRVRFEAGYGDAAAVPEGIKQAMLLLIGHWFEHREGVNIGNIVNELPFAVDSLLWPYRVFSF